MFNHPQKVGVQPTFLPCLKVLVELFQKWRRLADVFALLKSFGRAFSKARASEGGARLLAVATAK